MNLLAPFMPKSVLSDREREVGRRMGIWQVAAAGGLDGITSGGFLTAFALALGASNLQIGILTALPFIMQPVQIPAMILVQRLRKRKLIAVTAYFITHSLWIPIALIPFFIGVPSAGAVSALLGLIAIRGIANAFFSNTWISWLRDLVPQEILGRFFSRRQMAATLATAIVGLTAAFFIRFWKAEMPAENLIMGYTFAYLFGVMVFGWAAAGFMSFIPEPLMQSTPGPQPSFRQTITAPFRDRNFRQLINFLFLWNFASNLALPFFNVYMLQQLGIPLFGVIALGVLSQLSRILFARVWGPFADRFGSKVVLSLSTSLYLLVFLGWTFTATPDPHFLTLPLLLLLHIFSGAATSGINLTDMTLRMKLAPQSQAAAYLTGASLAINLGSGVSPLIGGFLADFFSVRALTFSFGWIDPSRSISFAALNLTGFDFLFVLAFALGLFTLNSLTTIQEEGEVDRQVVLDELLGEARESFQAVSSVPGLSFVSGYLPYGQLRRIPGLDVAVGVTAYQISSSARTAVSAASRGRSAAVDIADRIGGVVSSAVDQVTDIGEAGERQLTEIARNATRGAIHAVDEVSEDVGNLAKAAVLGTIGALSKSITNPRELLRGVGYGTVQGASETGANLAQATTQTIEGAKETAQELGLPEEEAAAQAAQGMLAAAESMGPEAAAQVREALAREGLLMETAADTPADGTDQDDDKATR